MKANQSNRLVLVVDDDEAIRGTYERVLVEASFPTLSVGSLKELQELVLTGRLFGAELCALIDMDLGENQTGIDVHEWLIDQKIMAGVIFVSGRASHRQIIDSFRRGALDFLLKPVTSDELTGAVGRVFQRYVEMPAVMPHGFKNLTAKETQVLRMVVEGLTGRQIASELSITERTVKMHRTNIMRKMHVKSSTQLVSLFHKRLSEMPKVSRVSKVSH